jgi:tRNA (adenine57-N1/adenine58-N1)-methyltransferase
MHGHTGFLITTRRLAPGVRPPERKRRPAQGAYGDASETESPAVPVAGSTAAMDVPGEAWTPEALGERVKSDKSIRRARRSVAGTSDGG